MKSAMELLVDVALGKLKPHAQIINGNLIDVNTKEILRNSTIEIYDKYIAAVDAEPRRYDDSVRVIDAKNSYLAPGFIDPHYHIESSLLNPISHMNLTLPLGTTTIFEGLHETGNALGAEGIRFFMRITRDLPQKIYLALPSSAPPSMYEDSCHIERSNIRRFLRSDRVCGVDEVMDYDGLFGHEEGLWAALGECESANKMIEGHGQPTGREADALIDSGVSSTHVSDGGEVLDMLRKGAFLMLKADKCEETIKKLLSSGVDLQMVGICTDDRPINELMEHGHMNYQVKKAIKFGIDPLTAIQMATLNNSRHWHAESRIGSISPGRFADILFISDLKDAKIERVIANGEIIEKKRQRGILKVPTSVSKSIKISANFSAENFAVNTRAEHNSIRGIVLKPRYFGDDVDELIETLPVSMGKVMPDSGSGINKAAIINRRSGKRSIAFIRFGYKQKDGATAMSVLHDSHNISVVGNSDEDIAIAVNRVIEMDGGIVVAHDKRVEAELSLPIAGLMSDLLDYRRVERGMNAVNKTTEALTGLRDLAFQQTFLFLTCFPRKIIFTEDGIIDRTSGKHLPLLEETW